MSESGWEAVARLERAVADASARLQALRGENQELRERVAELESERQREDEERSEAWRTERQEVAQRVERLAGGLEELLAGLPSNE
jgi:cell division protein FtsB